jgi:hypothetical protein
MHPCKFCGDECTCVVPKGCNGCWSCQHGDNDMDEGPEFQPCDHCDGHPACEDFGCAFKLGKGSMVQKPKFPDKWGVF